MSEEQVARCILLGNGFRILGWWTHLLDACRVERQCFCPGFPGKLSCRRAIAWNRLFATPKLGCYSIVLSCPCRICRSCSMIFPWCQAPAVFDLISFIGSRYHIPILVKLASMVGRLSPGRDSVGTSADDVPFWIVDPELPSKLGRLQNHNKKLKRLVLLSHSMCSCPASQNRRPGFKCFITFRALVDRLYDHFFGLLAKWF